MRPRSRAEGPVEPVEPGGGAGGAGRAGGAGGAGAAGERAGAAGPPEQAGAGRCRRSRPGEPRSRSRPEQAGAGRGRPGEPGRRAAGKKKKKKKIDRRFNRIYIRRRRKGERPSRDAAAKLCHKVWLFFDNLIKRRLCYGT